ncbi:hypothetical protein RBB50_009710 [Rhinocladiella similis]
MLAPTFVRSPLVTPTLAVLAKSGVEPGKGLEFVGIESVVDVAMRFAADENVHGRAWAVVSAGSKTGGATKDDVACDLGDDEDGLLGRNVLGEIVKVRRMAWIELEKESQNRNNINININKKDSSWGNTERVSTRVTTASTGYYRMLCVLFTMRHDFSQREE